jgi:isoquinoline 1-oxidoreductase beta subunit
MVSLRINNEVKNVEAPPDMPLLWVLRDVTIAKGRVQQSNFNDYRMLRINETPQIEVHLIKSGEAPGGIGETGATAAPPALGNALFAATGIRLRRLPIDRDVLSGKKPS